MLNLYWCPHFVNLILLIMILNKYCFCTDESNKQLKIKLSNRGDLLLDSLQEGLSVVHKNYTVELSIMYQELKRSQEIFDIARRKGYTIKGFYHTSTWKWGWKDVLLQQLYLLEGRRKIPTKFNRTSKTASYEWDER